MKEITLYGLNKCSTCVKARAWLTANGVAHRFVDYRDHPIDVALLILWAEQLGGWEKLVNRASMTWRNLPEDQKAVQTNAQWTALIAQNPAIVRRPVAVAPSGEVGVGFNEKRYVERFA
jgi:Spx/MgsR family transcriptional regulator